MSKELYTKHASGEVCRLAKTFADLHIQQNGRVFYFSSPASKPVTNADLLDFLEDKGVQIWIEPVNVVHDGFEELGPIRQYKAHVCKDDKVNTNVVSTKEGALDKAIIHGLELLKNQPLIN